MMNELLEQAYIKEIKPQLLYQFKKQDKSSIYGITQRLMAYNSNRIEGSTLTEDQTASIFETGTIMAEPDELFRTKDVEEMTGHFRMFNYCLTCLNAPLSIEMIKQMHYHLKVGVFEDMANGYPCGEFKNRANRVSNIITSQPGEVAEHMEALLDSYHKSSEHSLEDLAKFHARYETIHPFQEGNGRAQREFARELCLKCCYAFDLTKTNHKEMLSASIRSMDRGDNKGLENIFTKLIAPLDDC